MKKFAITVACVGALSVSTLGLAGPAAAAPSGFGNAQETVDSLKAQGYNVILNGAQAFPLSSCKVTGVEGMNNSNVNSAGARVDPTKFDTAYVDISCRADKPSRVDAEPGATGPVAPGPVGLVRRCSCLAVDGPDRVREGPE